MTEEEEKFKELNEKYFKFKMNPWAFLKIINTRAPMFLWCNIHFFYDSEKDTFHITSEINFLPKIIIVFIIPFVFIISLFRKDMDTKGELLSFWDIVFHRGSLTHYTVEPNERVNEKDIHKELIKIIAKNHPELVI